MKLGLRVGTVKHDAHSFEIDHPGKDSWRHGQAGAQAYAIASPERLAFITRLDGEMPLTDIARRFFAGFDLVVAEGYKRTAPHRVELFRVGAGHAEPLCGPGEAIALVTDSELRARAPLRAGRRRAASRASSPSASTRSGSTEPGADRARALLLPQDSPARRAALPPGRVGPTLDTAHRRVEHFRDAGGLIRIADSARRATRPNRERRSQPSEQRRSGVWRRT